ncbi:MAG: DNA repair protein RadC [Capnocytophaga sp.]|nr:DNA repair protein RadC [Capnocytophaga sp.]
MPIKNWSDTDKPREKLMNNGKSVLSNAELLAILLGSGSRNESAVALSRRILASANNQLTALGKLSLSQLQQFKGIGEAKAITIMAAMELGRRRAAEQPEEVQTIRSANDVFSVLQPIIGDLPHEEFWVLYLNVANKILQKSQLSKGGMTQTTVDIRLLFRTALETGATSIIIAHNHPSGNTAPSEADRQLTKKIADAGKNLDIRLFDHLIITENAYLSFADEGFI